MKTKSKDIEKQLIEAIRAAIRGGMSMNEVAQAGGVDHAALSRLLNGKRSLSLPSAAKLARVLGLELRKVEE